MPQHQSGPDDVADREEIELLPDDAVVALPRFLEAVEVRLEVFLLEPRGAVDPLEHLPPLVAPPVGPRRVQQLEVLQPARARHVRTAAKIHERPVGVDGDRLVVAQVGDALELERVVFEPLVGLVPAHHLAHEREVAPGDLHHLLLDALEILRREWPRDVEVVVEAVLDRRPEADPGAREQLAHRGGQDVGGRVAKHLEGVGIAVGEDRHLRVVFDRTVEVPDGAVHPRGQRRAGEPRPDGLGDLARAGAAVDLAGGAVRQGDADGADDGAHGASSTHGGPGNRLDLAAECQVQTEPDQEGHAEDEPTRQLARRHLLTLLRHVGILRVEVQVRSEDEAC